MEPIRLKSARHPFTAERDENGVPHVVARTWQEALYAWGYLHALDRPTQLYFARAVATGRAAEFIRNKPELYETDLFIRRAGLYRFLPRELKSLDDLWTDDLKGKIVVLQEFRDTVGVVMQSQGVDIASEWGRTEFENAVAFIEQKIDEGYIRKVKGNAYLEDLTAGTAYAGITWSGDIFTLAWDTGDPNWTFTIPESGGTLWSDNTMIPLTSNRQANAHKLIDYYYEPAVAAEVAAFVNYVCPVKGAQEEMMKIDPELAESPFIFPSAEYIAENNIQGFRALSATDDQEFAKIWSDRIVLGG